MSKIMSSLIGISTNLPFDGNLKDGVSIAALGERGVTDFSLIAGINVTDLVGMPHDISPVLIIVFEEFSVKFEILSNLHYYVVWFNVSVPFA